jgi:hypothetical protein
MTWTAQKSKIYGGTQQCDLISLLQKKGRTHRQQGDFISLISLKKLGGDIQAETNIISYSFLLFFSKYGKEVKCDVSRLSVTNWCAGLARVPQIIPGFKRLVTRDYSIKCCPILAK